MSTLHLYAEASDAAQDNAPSALTEQVYIASDLHHFQMTYDTIRDSDGDTLLSLDAAGLWLIESGPHQGKVASDVIVTADPLRLDLESPASRQHFIDTGRYLTHAEVAEYAL